MANLWKYWPAKELQKTLDGFDAELMQDLQEILPALKGSEFNRNELYLKENLVKVVEAFLPAESLSRREFRSHCLDRLPPDELRDLADVLVMDAPADTFEERRDAISARQWRGQFAEAFVNHFELPRHFLPLESEIRPDYQDLAPASREAPIFVDLPFKQLKRYQFEVYFEALSLLDTPRRRFVIQMPTGSGKTRTAMEVVSTFLNEHEDDGVVVWLVHSEELCEQAMQCFLDVWPHHARSVVRVSRCWGKHPLPALAAGRMLIVGGFPKLHAALRRDHTVLDDLKARVSLIVVDEAHKTEAPTYKQVVQSLLGPRASLLGLTATPGRTVEGEVEGLAAFYFNKRIGIPTSGRESVIRMLKDQGILSRVSFEPLITQINVDLTATQLRALEEQFDFPPSLLRTLGRSRVRNIEIARRLTDECERGSRVLFFGCSVKHSMFITSLLIYLGFRAEHVDGGTSRERRQAVIKGFREGGVQVLCNFGVLDTGFDAPNTDVVFIARPTASPVLYSQMIGRGLRGPAIGGTESCKIIDVRDNFVGFGSSERVYELFDEYWDD